MGLNRRDESEGVLALNTDGYILDGSPGVLSGAGYDIQELAGRNIRFGSLLIAPDAHKFFNVLHGMPDERYAGFEMDAGLQVFGERHFTPYSLKGRFDVKCLEQGEVADLELIAEPTSAGVRRSRFVRLAVPILDAIGKKSFLRKLSDMEEEVSNGHALTLDVGKLSWPIKRDVADRIEALYLSGQRVHIADIRDPRIYTWFRELGSHDEVEQLGLNDVEVYDPS